jgi:exodeoxyribonuclease VIII
MNRPAVMIDLETMGTTSNAAISSIGACLFEPHTDWIGDYFHIHVSLKNCHHHGLRLEPETVLWWLNQDAEARATVTSGQMDPAPLYTALDALAAFIPEDAEVWCKGPSFDFAILANAYDRCCLPRPWRYYRERCMRTVAAINKGAAYMPLNNAKHNALADAIHQARQVQHIFRANPDMDA